MHIQFFVRLDEALHEHVRREFRELVGVKVDRNFEGLANEAHFQRQIIGDPFRRQPQGAKGAADPVLDAGVNGAHFRRRVLVDGGAACDCVVGPVFGAEQPKGGKHARPRWYQHRADAEVLGDTGCVQGTGAAEGDQGEVTRVMAALRRDDLDGAEDVGVGQADSAACHFLEPEAERIRKAAENAPSRRLVDGHLAAEEGLRA